jgi:NAD(P)-dependent dehydrogenase (short-subunit alcohol dehydrogenase family)
VKRFNAAGWRVITVSRHPFERACPWHDGEDNHIQLDLSDLGAVERGIDELKARLNGGRLDALVNNAGISPKGRAAAGSTRLTPISTPGSGSSASISSPRSCSPRA